MYTYRVKKNLRLAEAFFCDKFQIMIFYLWLAALVAAIVVYIKQKYTHFSKAGVKHLKVIPPVGSMGKVITRKAHFAEVLTESYNAFPEER